MTKRILVVEDQEDVRGIVRDFFCASGYHVIEAVDGGEGVAKAQAEQTAGARETTAEADGQGPAREDEPMAGDRNLADRFEELFEMLDQDIRDTPTTSCLVIFGLGLLLGRALAA